MNPSFDLLNEPWIPVIRNSEISDVNLRELLLAAHEMLGISDALPIAEFGLYRFLVALVMDICQFRDSRDLEELMDARWFSPDSIEDYFRKHADCFDLFHPERPFLQTSGMEATTDKPFSGLLPCVPSGTAAMHFHHFDEADFGVSPAVAARLLTTAAPFMTAGGAGLAPSINGAPPWYVLVNGANLFQTLCLNCYVGPLELRGDAPPAWRNPLPPKSDGRCTSTSLLEALTWRPRQIQLIPGKPGTCSVTGIESPLLVRTMKFRAGASCDLSWTDPSVPYRKSEKGAQVMRPQEGKELWRDTGPLALLHDRAYQSIEATVKFSRPLLVDQFERLVQNGYLHKDTSLTLTAYGMRTDMKMKVFEWQKETLSVPVPMVVGSRFSLSAQALIEEAEKVEYALKKAVKHLYPRDASGNTRGLDNLVANAERKYWAALRSRYEEMLDKFASVPNGERSEERFAIEAEWRKGVRYTALAVFNDAADGFDTYGNFIQRQVEAQKNLYLAVGKILGSGKVGVLSTAMVEGGDD